LSGSLMSWIALIGALAVLLAIDLLVVRGRGGEMSLRAAAVAGALWVAVALAFGVVLLLTGERAGAETFLAGYLVEKSLSLDNVFVFLLVFTAFGLPVAERHRLLSYGIVAALALRAVFIVVGAAALGAVAWLSFVFAAFLVWTGWKMLRHRHDHGAEEAMVERLQRWLRPEHGRWALSTGAAALAAIAIVDVIFAVDSVPAILAITSDTFIVFAANAFALLGLRPLFFLVADLVDRLYYLKTALAVLLVFIGAKMAAAEFVGKIGPEYSLPAIAAILGTGVVASLIRNRRGILRECDFPESSPPSRPPSTTTEQSTSTPSQPTRARSSTPV
jgi:tellurite resistance protein TerC